MNQVTARMPSEGRPPAEARPPAEVRHSRGWPGAAPAISVVISTYRRPQMLAGLLQALLEQDLDRSRWEVVIVDNGSDDATWGVLLEAARGDLRMATVRLAENRGPGGGRNAGARICRAPLIGFTDDDCLPSPGWLSGLVAGFADGVDLVQGRVRPEPRESAPGPWDHTVHVSTLTAWAETCNVAYRRSAFEAAGGFDEADTVTHRDGGGRAFGEDVMLGWRVAHQGGRRRFAPEALVHHRIIPGTWLGVCREWRNCRGFPNLARRSGLVRDALYRRVFLTRDTARFDVAVVGVAGSLVLRRPEPLLAAVPWVRRRWLAVRADGLAPARAGLVVGQRAVVELVGLLSLLEGSARHRRLVL